MIILDIKYVLPFNYEAHIRGYRGNNKLKHNKTNRATFCSAVRFILYITINPKSSKKHKRLSSPHVTTYICLLLFTAAALVFITGS